MKLTLDLTGTELALLYITTGNEDAGRILREAYKREKEHQIANGIEPRKRWKRKEQGDEPPRSDSLGQ